FASDDGTYKAFRLIPGAMPQSAPLGFLLIGAWSAALLSLFGVGSTLHTTALPEFYGNFGLTSIAPSSPPTPSFTWVWTAAIVALGIHGWLVWRRPTPIVEPTKEVSSPSSS
ncbi:MAG: hypothetical protein ABEN55_10805, partial [Bradymonadaceae bacterium]